MLAPQRGLIATVESKSNRNSKNEAVRADRAICTKTGEGIFLYLSNFDSLPGKTGGLPIGLDCQSCPPHIEYPTELNEDRAFTDETPEKMIFT